MGPAAVYICQVCHKLFPTQTEVQQHLLSCITTGQKPRAQMPSHSKEQAPSLKTALTEVLPRLECPICGEHRTSVEYLNGHVKSHSVPYYGINCAFGDCTFNCATPAELKAHRQAHYRLFADPDDDSITEEQLHKLCNMTQNVERQTRPKRYLCNESDCWYWAKTTLDLEKHYTSAHQRTCRYCNKNVYVKEDFKRHLLEHGTETKGVTKCLHFGCSRTFFAAKDLRKHMDTHEGVNRFACQKCGQLNSNMDILKEHLLQHEQVETFACTFEGCLHSSNTLYDMQNHNYIKHSTIWHVCKMCGNASASLDEFEEHLRIHDLGISHAFGKVVDNETNQVLERVVPLVCHLCSKILQDRNQLKLHMMMKHQNEIDNPIKIKCIYNWCKQTFSSSAELRGHVAGHPTMIAVGRLECQLCGKTVKGSSRRLGTHVEKHKTEKAGVIKCIYKGCKQTFTTSVALKKHAANHWDSPRSLLQLNSTAKKIEGLNAQKRLDCVEIECQLCGKKNKSLLGHELHKVKHNTATPGVIQCIYEKCNEMFTSAADLKEHAVKHFDLSLSEHRPFTCDIPGCNVAFKVIGRLDNHKRCVHQFHGIQCHLCGKQFRNDQYLANHQRKFHNIRVRAAEKGTPAAEIDSVDPLSCKSEPEELILE